MLIEKISEHRRFLLPLWLLLIITFAPVLQADYVFYDEHVEVLANHLITAPLSFEGLSHIFTSFEANQYTPLSLTSFWLEYNIAGFNSTISHLINLLLHLLCATMVFFIAEFLLHQPLLAFAAAALWAAHPLQVETVAWVLERRNLLYGCFYFASLCSYIGYMKLQQKKFLVAATVFMVFSCLSKTLAFFLPFNWLMLDWLKSREVSWKLVSEKAVACLIAVLMLVVMLVGAKGSITGSGVGVFNWRLAGYNFSFYAAKALLPVNLSPTYEINSSSEDSFASGPVYFTAFLLISVLLARKNRLAAFAMLFFFFHILPLSGFIRVGYKFYAVLHFMYIALFGIIIALVSLARQNITSDTGKRLVSVFALALLIAFSITSFNYCQVWQNSQTLFEYCLRHDPDNRFARNQLAVFLETKGRKLEAQAHYRELIERYPVFFGGYYGLGRIFMQNGQYEDALAMLNKAVEYNQKRSDIQLDRGYVYIATANYREAEADLTESLGYRENLRARFLRSKARRLQGDYSGAIEDLSFVSQHAPDDFSIKISLGEVLIESGRWLHAGDTIFAALSQIWSNQQNWENYWQTLSAQGFLGLLSRMAPYRHLIRYRFGWYPV